MKDQLNTTVPEAFDAFVSTRRSERVSQNTVNLYYYTHRLWMKRWPGVLLHDISPTHVRTFLLWLDGKDEVPQPDVFKSATIHIHWRNTRNFLRWCEAEGLINGSKPLQNVKAPKLQEVKPDALTEWEALAMLQRTKAEGGVGFRNYVLLLFFLTTGARLKEVVDLNLEDVKLDQGITLLHGKGDKERFAPLFDMLPAELKLYLLRHRRAPATERALFVTDDGKRMNRASVQKVVIDRLQWYVPRALAKTGPHTLRHTACTLLLRRLKDVHTVKAIMGHSAVEVTERYIHLSFDDVRGIVRPTLDELLRTARKAKRRPRLKLLAAPGGV